METYVLEDLGCMKTGQKYSCVNQNESFWECSQELMI